MVGNGLSESSSSLEWWVVESIALWEDNCESDDVVDDVDDDGGTCDEVIYD